MALQCDKELQSGVTMGYHRVSEAIINYDTNSCMYKVASYLSEAARRAGKQPVEQKQMTIYFTEGIPTGDIRAHFYKLAMEPQPPVELSPTGVPIPAPWNEVAYTYPSSVAV